MLAATSSSSAIWTFLLYTVIVFVMAGFANRLLQGRNFLSEYFLGSRGLGVWAFALTFAATSASGGSFTGFPAKIYTHGWILALWIASYMVYPICTMGFLGKRINQVARKTGAITVPDILRDRFNSPAFGLMATVLIVFFLTFNMVAQFKAGSVILQTLIQDAEIFRVTSGYVGNAVAGFSFFSNVNPGYLTCLLLFGVAVIVYTTYGGFHAVVWTDVMQGIVMLAGVMIMLPLIYWQVGGFQDGARELARMVPPRLGTATIEVSSPVSTPFTLSDLWFIQAPAADATNADASSTDASGEPLPRLFRMSGGVAFRPNETTVQDVRFVEVLTPEEIRRQLDRLQTPVIAQRIETVSALIRRSTKNGDFAANFDSLRADDAVAVWPATTDAPLLVARLGTFREYDYGANQPGHYMTGPGPLPPGAGDNPSEGLTAADGFMPLGLAISFFFMWAISGTGQPQYMVRLMAFKDATTLRRAIMTVTAYYAMIYFPLVAIFCFSRILLPGMEYEADTIMPTLAVTLTENVGHGWLAGLLIAAPFAAVMSTVDSYLLVISSAIVRDVYQRNINPNASQKAIKRMSYLATLSIGSLAMIYAINPPSFLQDLIVYVGSGLAACFLFPVVAALYWPRSNLAGCMGGMLGGFASHLLMHIIGWSMYGEFTRPYNLFGCSPVLIGLAGSLLVLLIVTPLTPRPSEELVRRYFHRDPPSA